MSDADKNNSEGDISMSFFFILLIVISGLIGLVIGTLLSLTGLNTFIIAIVAGIGSIMATGAIRLQIVEMINKRSTAQIPLHNIPKVTTLHSLAAGIVGALIAYGLESYYFYDSRSGVLIGLFAGFISGCIMVIIINMYLTATGQDK